MSRRGRLLTLARSPRVEDLSVVTQSQDLHSIRKHLVDDPIRRVDHLSYLRVAPLGHDPALLGQLLQKFDSFYQGVKPSYGH